MATSSFTFPRSDSESLSVGAEARSSLLYSTSNVISFDVDGGADGPETKPKQAATVSGSFLVADRSHNADWMAANGRSAPVAGPMGGDDDDNVDDFSSGLRSGHIGPMSFALGDGMGGRRESLSMLSMSGSAGVSSDSIFFPAELRKQHQAATEKLNKDPVTRVGAEFQADVGVFVPHPPTRPASPIIDVVGDAPDSYPIPEPESDELMWRPNPERMPDAKLDQYIADARGLALRFSLDTLLHALLKADYDPATALAALQVRAAAENAAARPHPDYWTATELRVFEELVASRGHHFGRIATLMQTKTRAQCVAHYYRCAARGGGIVERTDEELASSTSDDEASGPRLHHTLGPLSEREDPYSLVRRTPVVAPAATAASVAFDDAALSESRLHFYPSTDAWAGARRSFLDSPVMDAVSFKRKRAAMEAEDARADAGGAGGGSGSWSEDEREVMGFVAAPPLFDSDVLLPAAKRRRLEMEVDAAAEGGCGIDDECCIQ